MQNIVEQLYASRVIPVVVLEDKSLAGPLADALIAGGLACIEITLRTEQGLGAISKMASRGDILVGAGTVLTVDQAKASRDAGARFIVSPGLSPAVVEWCLKQTLPVFPGISTPTEIMVARDLGLAIVKFFPAEASGGLDALKAFSAVFADMRYMPTGGITRKNVTSYLALDSVLACGGSWLVRSDWLLTKHFDRIQEETQKTMQLVKDS